MDWANVTKIKPLHLPNVISRPDEHALYKDNFAAGNAFSPQPRGRISFGAGQKERSLLGRECQKRMPKVIADIEQRDGNVLFLFH